MNAAATLTFVPEIALSFIGDDAKLKQAIAHFGADSVAVSDPESCYTVFASDEITLQSVYILARILQSSIDEEITTDAVIRYYLGDEAQHGEPLASIINRRDSYATAWTLNGESLRVLHED